MKEQICWTLHLIYHSHCLLCCQFTSKVINCFLLNTVKLMFALVRWWQVPYYWAGIKAYDLVSGDECLKSSYYLSKERALELFPMLKSDKLKGAIVYYDGKY